MEFSMFTVLSLIVVVLLISAYLRVIYEYLRKAKVKIVASSRAVAAAGTANNSAADDNDNNCIKTYQQAPGPFPWPILGNLALLGQYEVPFEGFTELSKRFGDIYSLTLGTTRCLVVNNLDLIREVLNKNGKFFGGRPDFLRYHKLFGGDRNNSLALCDWSQLQQKRRNLARRHCSPRESSSIFAKMSDVGCREAQEFTKTLEEKIIPGEEYHIKPVIQRTCANMFIQYMTSMRFDVEDKEFQKIVEYFDEIFWEINQGYAVDFLPWLSPFYKNHFKKIVSWSKTIRKFILDRVIRDREQNLRADEPDKDFTDALLRSLAEDKNVSRDMIIFMLEDFIGGHSAVGNLVMLTLAYLVKNPHVCANIQQEIDLFAKTEGRDITLMDMDNLSYTMATIFEVLRYSSSPIVPHVATTDAVIAGYGVTAGTIVFINNYKLNTSETYWDNPNEFDPERFLENSSSPTVTVAAKKSNSESYDSGIEFERETTTTTTTTTAAATQQQSRTKTRVNRLKKNIPHFLPFSIGKRTCIGQNLVRGFGFILLVNILQKYNVSCKDISTIKINPACVALPAKTFPLLLTPRTSD